MGRWIQATNKFKDINYKYAASINIKYLCSYLDKWTKNLCMLFCFFVFLPNRSFEEILVLACWCSVPAHPPEGGREPQTNEPHFTWSQKYHV